MRATVVRTVAAANFEFEFLGSRGQLSKPMLPFHNLPALRNSSLQALVTLLLFVSRETSRFDIALAWRRLGVRVLSGRDSAGIGGLSGTPSD